MKTKTFVKKENKVGTYAGTCTPPRTCSYGTQKKLAAKRRSPPAPRSAPPPRPRRQHRLHCPHRPHRLHRPRRLLGSARGSPHALLRAPVRAGPSLTRRRSCAPATPALQRAPRCHPLASPGTGPRGSAAPGRCFCTRGVPPALRGPGRAVAAGEGGAGSRAGELGQ